MEMLKGVPNKERFDEESRRIHASIARAGDTPLEQKANANEIFRCCLHKWSEEEDDRLWAIHAKLIVKWHQINDVAERKGQLVSIPERETILEAASHLLMVHDWPVNCPRFMEALRLVGLDCVSQMRYLRMDYHLLTALVERWSPQTNSFHLTVGEMTITLQDVAMILGVHIDGPALVGHHVVGAGRRWLSWPDCCDDLLGSHPLADVVYRDPFDHRSTSRWNEDRLRELPVENLITYRDELDGLLDSQVIWQPYTPDIQAQVPQICLSGADIWTARVPVISWKRVEWHLPDRVLRQFGLCPRIDIQPMDPSFNRVDGRGKPDMDWMLYHRAHIAIWESRRGFIVTGDLVDHHNTYSIHQYIHWYKSWATLYMLKAPVEPPTTAYPRAPSERLLRDFFLGTEQALQQHFNGTDDTPQQRDINTIAELCRGLHRQLYIQDQGYFEDRGEHDAPFSMTQEPPHQYSGYAGPSSYPDQGPSTDLFSSQVPADLEAYLSPDFVPSSIHTDDIAEEEAPEEEQHMLRQRPRRPPKHYTPGTDALPQRPRRRR
ncbi:hypothetical protein KFK09_027477 [Dendrobium nobile]|uniref:Aminotransferase-like plant mobile domain-containing protein n=1 Tax=Dendrobium nobile TaxID=94219 RepID=A0A8T3AB37_DENNO|nr:hypothetical protein KFK09_027477 [Dendrobium nobile]